MRPDTPNVFQFNAPSGLEGKGSFGRVVAMTLPINRPHHAVSSFWYQEAIQPPSFFAQDMMMGLDFGPGISRMPM
ncbi:hypothetical protein D3C71_1832010 [compost metagenome]